MTEREKAEKKIKDFLKEEKLTGRSPQAMGTIRRSVMRFNRFLEETGLEAEEVGLSESLLYSQVLSEHKTKTGESYSPKTILSHLHGASRFMDYLKRQRRIKENPFAELKKPRQGIRLPKDLPREKEMDQLLQSIGRFDTGNLRTSCDNYRFHLISELLYSTGMRISEASALKVEDVDLYSSRITIRNGKGGRQRTAFLNEYCCRILRIYIQEMRDLVLTEQHDRTLLFGTRWQTLSGFVNKRLRVKAACFGFPGFTSHNFRHCVGYHLLRSGCQVRYIQEILGHKTIRSTEIYTKIDKDRLKAVLDNFHPRKWKDDVLSLSI